MVAAASSTATGRAGRTATRSAAGHAASAAPDGESVPGNDAVGCSHTVRGYGRSTGCPRPPKLLPLVEPHIEAALVPRRRRHGHAAACQTTFSGAAALAARRALAPLGPRRPSGGGLTGRLVEGLQVRLLLLLRHVSVDSRRSSGHAGPCPACRHELRAGATFGRWPPGLSPLQYAHARPLTHVDRERLPSLVERARRAAID